MRHGFRCSASSVVILHLHSYPTNFKLLPPTPPSRPPAPSTSSTNPNMHFKASKHGSLLNHNRHFAAHSLFIASINMEKPCLNSPVIGSPLMLTVIMVILVPGIITRPPVPFHSDPISSNKLLKVENRCSFFVTAAVSQQKTMEASRPNNHRCGGGQMQQSVHTQLLTGKACFANAALQPTVGGNHSLQLPPAPVH